MVQLLISTLLVAVSILLLLWSRYRSSKNHHGISFGEWLLVTALRTVMYIGSRIGGGRLPAGRKLVRLAYGDLPEETLEILQPAPSSFSKPPIIHIHGGGWIGLSAGPLYAKPLGQLSDNGYLTVSVNYPLSPEYAHPQALMSLLHALAFLKKKDGKLYGAVHVTGDSAGGHLAMMVSLIVTNPKLLALFDDTLDVKSLPTIKSVIPLYGVLDRTSGVEDGFPFSRLLIRCYAGAAALEPSFTSKLPVFPLDVKDIESHPPTFIVGASKDELLRSSQLYAEHLKKKNVGPVELKVYEGEEHGFFSAASKRQPELMEDMLAFVAKYN